MSDFSQRGKAMAFSEFFAMFYIFDAFLMRYVFFVAIFYDLCVLSTDGQFGFVSRAVGFLVFISIIVFVEDE